MISPQNEALGLLLPVTAFAAGRVEIADGLFGYLSVPEHGLEETVPGVVIIHDWWGIHDADLNDADRFATHGMAALIVDLFHGQVALDFQEAHKLKYALQERQVFQELALAIGYLQAMSRVDEKRVGIVGLRMGGEWAYRLSAEESRIRVAVIVEWGPAEGESRSNFMKGPLFFLYGSQDEGVSSVVLERIKKLRDLQNQRTKILNYAGMDHSFMDPIRKEHDPQRAEDAWRELIIFLKANLA